MTTPKALKKDAFISYARRDGREAAAKLFKLLEEHGLSAWQDVVSMAAGENWWQQIREAIEGSKSMVLVLTEGAVNSIVVKREWAHARKCGTAIVPVTTELNFYDKAPRWVGEVHGFILNEDHPDYARNLEAFLDQLRQPNPPPPVPLMAPLLPLEFASRPAKQAEILDRLLQADDAPIDDPAATPQMKARTATVALLGEAGMGKSTLAQAVCYEQSIIENYTGGVLYVEVGESAAQMGDKLNRVLVELHDAPVTPDKAPERLRELLRERTCLIVFDDVWDDRVIEPYLGIDGQSYLITTREAAVAARDSSGEPVRVREMLTDEAAQMLLNYVAEGKRPADGLAQLEPLAQRLGEWALLLDGAGRELRAEMAQGSSLADAIAWVQAGLDESGLTAQSDFAAALDARMQSSLRRFSADEAARLYELSIFPDDVDVPEVAALRLWSQTSKLTRRQCEKLLRRFAGQFFLREAEGGVPVIRFHDALREYLAGQLSADGAHAAHEALIAAYRADSPNGWASGPNDGYFFERLAYHLYHAERKDELYELLTESPSWMEAKFTACIGDASYVEDLALALSDFRDPLPDKEAVLNLVLLHSARQVVNARVDVYTDTDLQTLVWLGREREALAHARLRAESDKRFDGMMAVNRAQAERGTANTALVDEALGVARGIEDAFRRTEALSTVAVAQVQAGMDSHAVFEEALGMARAIEAAVNRAAALRAVAAAQAQAGIDSHAVFEEALGVARAIEAAVNRAAALGAVAAAQAQAGIDSHAVFEEALGMARAVEAAVNRAWALGAVAADQAQAGIDSHAVFEEALGVARKIEDVYWRGEALGAVAADQAQAGYYEEALGVARGIEDDFSRAAALRAVAAAQARAGIDNHVVFEEALAVTRGIEAPDGQAWTLQAVAAAVVRAGRYEEALGVARAIEAAVSRAQALGAVAAAQAQAGMDSHAVFEEALTVARKIEDAYWRTEALGAVAADQAQAGYYEEALGVARGIEDDFSRAAALRAVAAAQAQAGMDSHAVFEEALGVARGIEAPDGQAWTLQAVAAAQAQAGMDSHAVFEEALGMARAIEAAVNRAAALRAVAAAQAQAGIDSHAVFEEALGVARAIEAAVNRAAALGAVAAAQAQAGIDSHAVFEEALGMARGIEAAVNRAAALGAVAAAQVQAGYYEEALAAARGIEDGLRRAWALSEVAGAQAAAGIDSHVVFYEALGVARGIEDGPSRAEVLRAVAAAQAQAGNFVDAFDTLGARGPTEFVRVAAEWWEHFERIVPGLGLAALREVLRIACWVRPSWQPVYESVARAAAETSG